MYVKCCVRYPLSSSSVRNSCASAGRPWHGAACSPGSPGGGGSLWTPTTGGSPVTWPPVASSGPWPLPLSCVAA